MYDLLQLMYQDGHLSSTELTALRKTCRDLRENPVRVLRSLNIVSQPEIQGLLQRFYGVDAATDELVENMDMGMTHVLPVDLALNYSAVAVGDHDGHLVVLLEDPTDARILHSLEFFLGRAVRPVVATATQIARALSKAYRAETGDLRLTTVLEAARGVEGGAVYDASQITPFAKDDELLVDKGERYGTLRETLREGSLGSGVPRLGGAESGKARSKALPQPTLAPPLPESDPDTLAAHLASSHFGALSGEEALPEEADFSAAPRQTKSVFDEFEGMEALESIDPSLAQANDTLLEERAEQEPEPDGIGGDGLPSEIVAEAPPMAADGEAIPGDFDDSFDDDMLNAEPASDSPSDPASDSAFDPASAPLSGREGPANKASPSWASASVSTSALAAAPAPSAPASKEVSAAVSRLMVKLSLARGLEDACQRANAVLGPMGFRLEPAATGGVMIEETSTGARLEVSTAADLDLLPASAAPLAPALRQLFRPRARA